MHRPCPFCREIAEKPDTATASAVRLEDLHPVVVGHCLVVPVRHVERIEDLSIDEWSALFLKVRQVVADVVRAEGVDGVNIGINSGAAAGQTVGHTHVHVIPRSAGDCADPRGGVRWVIPEEAEYWTIEG
jgi:diadenosine tetraphosphate (Ap4A) HIT family hydrolase